MDKGSSRLLAVAGLIACAPSMAMAMGSRPANLDEEATLVRIQPVAKVRLAPLSAPGPATGDRSGADLYKAVCGACHTTGVANAPKTGDKAAWAPLISTGLNHMLEVAIKGKGAMPPRGGSDGTDDELKRSIIYMANQSGAQFKE